MGTPSSWRNEWYVNYMGDKIFAAVEVFVDREYEINVSDFQGSIKPTPENDLDEDIGWYFKILPEKIVGGFLVELVIKRLRVSV